MDDIDSVNKMIDEQLEYFASRYNQKDTEWLQNIQETIEKTGIVTERQAKTLDGIYSRAFGRQ